MAKEEEILFYTNYDLDNVVTPVKALVLENLLREANYNPKKISKLVKGFTKGFSIGYRGPKKVRRFSPNLKLTVGSETVLWNKVMKEVKLKRFAGPYPIDKPPFEHFIQSPIGLVPKDNGKDTRLIFHLSYPKGGATSVNANTPKRYTKVKYPDFSDAIKVCLSEGKSCFISRSDLKSAFRGLGVRKRYWKYLLMKARNPLDKKWYLFVDKCVPFGNAASCKLFQEFSDCLAHLVQFRTHSRTMAKKRVTNYLDDFLFVALLKYFCDAQCQHFLDICAEINFPVALDKTFWGSNRMTFLGFLIDTVDQIVCVPVEKIAKGMNMIRYVLKKRKITLLELQKLCGYLNFLCRCIVPGRAFTRRLYSKVSPKLKSHHHIRVSPEMRLDLSVWSKFLEHPTIFARPFLDYDKIQADKLNFYSDASKSLDLGFGAYFNDQFIVEKWDKDFILEQDPSIAYLELYALSAALLLWMPKLKNRRVIVFTDNQNAQANINSMSSTCKNSMILVRLLVFQQMVHNVRIYAEYVESRKNVGADDLSRLRINKFIRDQEKLNVHMHRCTVPNSIWPMSKIWIK